MTTGSSQLGFRTMSSKVLFGENKTPNTRPKGLIVAACASGTGVGVVAIEDSSTTRFGTPLFDKDTHRNRRKFQRQDSSADRDQSASRLFPGGYGTQKFGFCLESGLLITQDLRRLSVEHSFKKNLVPGAFQRPDL
ncbi:MAG: hypothetical protein DMG40_18070 [Acidobacteria bacterium]|nr:MAG: hypothetical protein DMG40_18070 [Acidobacteriota bacterium]